MNKKQHIIDVPDVPKIGVYKCPMLYYFKDIHSY